MSARISASGVVMADRLEVRLFGRPVGILEIKGPLRSPEDWSFQYRADYVAQVGAQPISARMPVRSEAYTAALVQHWACNLLPEGGARQSITDLRPETPLDDFDLLSLLGRECAGALEFRPVDGGECENARAMEGSDDWDLEKLILGKGLDAPWFPFNLRGHRTLAGAQDKVAVVVEQDGFIRLPVRGELSSHLLKPDSQRLPGLRDREALGMALALAVGLPVAKADPVEIASQRALLIERYDRAAKAGGDVVALHQEDFCQLLGLPSQFKYEVPNGRSLGDIVGWCRVHLADDQTAESDLMSWVVFNLLIGNADAHAKNLSILQYADGGRRLAPAYDLVPTISFSEGVVDRTPALRIGNANRIDTVTRHDLALLAESCRWPIDRLHSRIMELAGRISECLPTVREALVEQGCREEGMARYAEAISMQFNRIKTLC